MLAKGVYTPPVETMRALQRDSGTMAEFACALEVDTRTPQAAAPLYNDAEALGCGDKDAASFTPCSLATPASR